MEYVSKDAISSFCEEIRLDKMLARSLPDDCFCFDKNVDQSRASGSLVSFWAEDVVREEKSVLVVPEDEVLFCAFFCKTEYICQVDFAIEVADHIESLPFGLS